MLHAKLRYELATVAIALAIAEAALLLMPPGSLRDEGDDAAA